MAKLNRVSSWLGLPEAALSRGPRPPEPAPRRQACSPPQATRLPAASAAHRTRPCKPPPRSAAAPPRRAAPQARPPPGGRRSGASAPRGPPRQNKGMREGLRRRAGHREARPVAAQGERLGSRSLPATARRVPGLPDQRGVQGRKMKGGAAKSPQPPPLQAWVSQPSTQSGWPGLGTSAVRPRRAGHVVWLLKGSASTPPPRRALRHRNINFPEIRRHYAIAGRRRESAAARATCGRQGAAIKAATLRWRVPPPAKAAKVYVMHAPRILAASRQPCAAPARIPRPTPAGRALQERARSRAGPPGPPVGGALTVVLILSP
ncbi:putative HTLV-1-related endogenous sequence [Mus caroli]|uniref:HTLV-1-related endogenous sequence n=1 Tax=Mus caroli TaxID=10089 RepID=A0A6P5QY29_MUSCR|nr:putative HTLV-1-related endogenous sequence [Mus caroli]